MPLGQPVALKFLPEGLERDENRLPRFLNEVRTALWPQVVGTGGFFAGLTWIWYVALAAVRDECRRNILCPRQSFRSQASNPRADGAPPKPATVRALRSYGSRCKSLVDTRPSRIPTGKLRCNYREVGRAVDLGGPGEPAGLDLAARISACAPKPARVANTDSCTEIHATSPIV